jgi:hypothetical protein
MTSSAEDSAPCHRPPHQEGGIPDVHRSRRRGHLRPIEALPLKYLPRPEVRDLPAPPTNQWRFVGPGIIAAGVGLASGEFILFPCIASQIGLGFVWAALLGLITQYFLNMEIECCTPATGETALTGFSRLWRH